TLEVESLDRMYLNVYVPGLQYESGVAAFFRAHRGQLFASSALMAPMSKAFVAAIEAFVAEHTLPLIPFAKGRRKDAVMAQHLARFPGDEGLLFVGKALDNGLLSCAEPRQLQALCDGLAAAKIDALVRKWLARLPHPFTPRDRRAGYRYEVSILQAEFSLTQVLDRPVTGRLFFEAVIRENLDLGRPDQVQLIFDRRVSQATPGRFRTRVITEGVTPSVHVDYKHTRIKQYHKT